MNQYFEAVVSCDPNRKNRAAWILEGKGQGAKALWSGGECLYDSDPDGFLARHAERIQTAERSGVIALDGRRIYTEILGNTKKIVICGAGHVSLPIIRLCKMIGCHVTVIEDREQYAALAGSAGADQVVCDAFESALAGIPGDQDTYFIIVTRDHQWDTLCLKLIAQKPHGYIGMMGSARRVKLVKEHLIQEGLDEETIRSVHSPIGLKINAATPEEIAVSIVAEIIQVKNEKKDSVYPSEILRAILGGPHETALPGRKIMATIVSKQGSAPRDPGTKMLLTEAGTQVGTIGGGYTEACIVSGMQSMLAEEHPAPRLIQVNLMAEDIHAQGEICGGLIDIWLEEV